MKILNIKFKNINSLAGEWEIDFTEPQFTDNGLFAITGKTGSGKSSILDAISLALYGKTPRVEITGQSNDVMTRGGADCYSEIVFEVGGEKWKSSWKQEKTRTGNLKPVGRQIANQDDKIVADQVRSCDSKIIEILGLTFEQFTKVVMLAQGSFAAFLQAEKNDKGELLEQITGTEIYGEISKKVFERNKTEAQKLEIINLELGAIKILSTEEIEIHNQEILESEENKKRIDSELQAIETAKKWLVDLATLQKQIAESTTRLPALEAKETEAKTALQIAENELKTAKDELEKATPVFVKVRELDTKIGEKQSVLHPIFESLKNATQATQHLTQKLQKDADVLDKLNVDLQNKNDWKTQNATYESLIGNYSAIENQHSQVQTLLGDFQAKQKAHAAAQKDLEDKNLAFADAVKCFEEKHTALEIKTQELKSQKENLFKLLNNKELTDLQSQKENLIHSGTNVKFLIDNIKIIVSNKQNIENLQKIITENSEKQKTISSIISTNTDSIQNLKKQMDILAENIRLTQIVQDLDEHRKLLEDGKQCPLCGATEHPFAKGNEPKIDEKDKELKALGKQSDEINILLLTNEKLLATAKTNIDNALSNKRTAEKELAENRKKTEQILSEVSHLDCEIAETDACITKLEQLRSSKQAEYQQLNILVSSAEKLEKEIKKLQEEIFPKYQTEEKVAEKAKTDTDTARKIAEKDTENTSNLTTQAEAKYRQESENLKNTLAKYGIDNVANLKKCLEDWTSNTSAIEKLTNQQTQLKNDMQLSHQEMEQAKKIVTEQTNNIAKLEKEKQNLQNERKELLGEKRVEDEEKRLKHTIANKEQNRISSHEMVQAIEKTIAEIRAVIKLSQTQLAEKQAEKTTEKTLEELQSEQDEKKPQADELSQKIGANRQALTSNAENLKQNSNKLKEKERQQQICTKWGSLNELIGSGDGKKYRNFAQALTFEHLIGLANSQLQRMSERYILKRVGDAANPFELSVIDKFQNCDERTAQNLSGGEKFIVSLSLALGLANMASKNMKIDTLFIDEGFGTLDTDYLDVALTALSNLQNEGKLIGVISHLAELKERIATHIEVVPDGNGHSRIEIHN